MSLERTDDDRHDGVQQDPNIKTMLIPNFPIRIVDQDKLFLDNLQSLLVRMKAVEEALDAFRMFVSTQKELDKPLNLWLKYDKYPILAAAYKDLQDTVTRVNTFVTLTSFNKCCIKSFTTQARTISVKVSNTVASLMEIISKKTNEFEAAAETEAVPIRSLNQETTTATIVAQLGMVIKHLTSAAKSEWAALDLLESLPSKSLTQQDDQFTAIKSYLSWAWCAIVALLAAAAMFQRYDMFGTRSVPQQPRLHDMIGFISGIQSVCGALNMNLRATASFQNTTLSEFDLRLQNAEKTLASNNERIDNVWEALGPPNAQGTYFTHNAMPDQATIPNAKAYKALNQRLDKLQDDALEFKRQVQRSEVRMSTRMNKLARERGN